MADFAPNFTARYKLRYSSLNLVHTMQWRIARGSGATGLSNMILKVAAFLNNVVSLRFTDWTALSATYAAEDSDIFLPAGIGAISAGVAVIPLFPLSESIVSTGFVGRSLLGQKARVFVYGMQTSPILAEATTDNFRLTNAEQAAIAAAVGTLNSSSPSVVGSDNAVVTWYPYANVKFNDYWLRRIRS